MMFEDIEFPYLPGEQIKGDRPLDRYLPPIRKGVAASWLEKNIAKGSWLLDPFGASPELVIEAAQNGYTVLVTANNPVTRFILEILCKIPKMTEYKAAIAALAAMQVGGERLEPHIKRLYETNCMKCNQTIQAESFLWRKEESAPYGRVYVCPFCGDAGERPTTPQDKTKAEGFSKTGIHRARALERVAPLHDPDRRHVEEALEVYLPRAIYALVTIINKLNGIPKSDPNHTLLSALLLLAFDRGNTLWLYPKERQRPRQLTIPSQFREDNIWLALESAIEIWTSLETPTPISKWPEPPSSGGGICLYEGRIKELAASLPKIDVSAVLTAFPRPNQAFWTLSALWSGWLWGSEAGEHFKSVLRRRRYDWGWHANAIQSALISLAADLPVNTPYFGLITEVEPGFLSAVVLGCQLADLKLSGAAMRLEDGQAQLVLHHPSTRILAKDESKDLEATINEYAYSYLRELRGEPSPYSYLHLAGLLGLVKNSTPEIDSSPSDYLSLVSSAYQRALSFKNGYIRFEGSSNSLEIGKWWIQNPDPGVMPLSDRIEIAIVNALLKHPGSNFSEIETVICESLPGIAPPDSEIIEICLESYGHQDDLHLGWFLQDGEHPEKRRTDMHSIKEILIELGNRLEFQTNTKNGQALFVQWNNKSSNQELIFFISASAILGKYLFSSTTKPSNAFIVLPGSRANLVAYKLKQNFYLRNIVDKGWRFIKYRHLRQLAESPTLNIDQLEEQLSLDPITYTKPQMRLL